MVNKNTPITNKHLTVFNFIIIIPPFLTDPASWNAILSTIFNFVKKFVGQAGLFFKWLAHGFFWMRTGLGEVALGAFPVVIKLG